MPTGTTGEFLGGSTGPELQRCWDGHWEQKDWVPLESRNVAETLTPMDPGLPASAVPGTVLATHMLWPTPD
jgi:hypothetical protein